MSAEFFRICGNVRNRNGTVASDARRCVARLHASYDSPHDGERASSNRGAGAFTQTHSGWDKCLFYVFSALCV